MSLGRAGHIRKIDERQIVLRGKQRTLSDHMSRVHRDTVKYNVYSTENTRYVLFS